MCTNGKAYFCHSKALWKGLGADLGERIRKSLNLPILIMFVLTNSYLSNTIIQVMTRSIVTDNNYVERAQNLFKHRLIKKSVHLPSCFKANKCSYLLFFHITKFYDIFHIHHDILVILGRYSRNRSEYILR